jgi:glycerophosphoryl diester phosphodiesterase
VSGKIRNIAHRGASAYEPENTLAAIEKAIELGADMIEIDVHLSSDGVPVIIHDYRLSRMTNGTGWVKRKSLAELKELTIHGGSTIPTLEEVIDTVVGRCGLYIELKGSNAAQPTVELLRRKKFTDVIVASFKERLIRTAKRIAPEFRTSLLSGEVGADFEAMARSARADCIHLCFESKAAQPHKLLTPALLAELRATSLGIILWHEERPSELKELVKLDVDAICTNAPDLLNTALDR